MLYLVCIDWNGHIVLEIEYPEYRKLAIVPKVPPAIPGQKIKPTTKNLIDIRGPELKDNYLIHKQYGIRVCVW